jgi:hypothetical protein
MKTARRLLGLAMCLLLAGTAHCQDGFDLASRQWTLTNENGTVVLPVQVPAHVLEVVRSAGLIGDPLYR